MTDNEAYRYAVAATRPGRTPHPERYSSRTMDNPLYRAQLAQARLGRELARAESFGVHPPGSIEPDAHAETVDPATTSLARLVADSAAHTGRGGYALTRYLAELSTAVLFWLETAQLWPADRVLAPTLEHETRCAVARAARIVVVSSLTSLGITAPERI